MRKIYHGAFSRAFSVALFVASMAALCAEESNTKRIEKVEKDGKESIVIYNGQCDTAAIDHWLQVNGFVKEDGSADEEAYVTSLFENAAKDNEGN